jgi:hypothetical protein
MLTRFRNRLLPGTLCSFYKLNLRRLPPSRHFPWLKTFMVYTFQRGKQILALLFAFLQIDPIYRIQH